MNACESLAQALTPLLEQLGSSHSLHLSLCYHIYVYLSAHPFLRRLRRAIPINFPNNFLKNSQLPKLIFSAFISAIKGWFIIFLSKSLFIAERVFSSSLLITRK
jgi:hypothetical protein